MIPHSLLFPQAKEPRRPPPPQQLHFRPSNPGGVLPQRPERRGRHGRGAKVLALAEGEIVIFRERETLAKGKNPCPAIRNTC